MTPPAAGSSGVDYGRRRSLGRMAPAANSVSAAAPLPAPVLTTGSSETAAQQKRMRLQSRTAELTTESPARDRIRGQSHASPAGQAQRQLRPDQLKEHYLKCIQLSTNNKIGTSNAFDLHLIDYMAALVRSSGEVNFKLATTALDAGTKIYVSRVDCVHTDVTKVANSIVQAMENKSKKGAAGDEDAEEDEPDPDQDHEAGDEASNRKEKAKRVVKRKTGSKLAPNPESLNIAALETSVEIDPIFHKLTTSHDMGNVNSLLLANLPVDGYSALVLDSNAENDLKPDATTAPICSDLTSLKEFSKTLTEIVDKECRVFDDKYFSNFKFNRDNEDCETEFNRFEDEMMSQRRTASTFLFDLNADIDDAEDQAPPDFNLSQNHDIFDELNRDSDLEDSVDELRQAIGGVNRHSIMQAVNLQSLPDLKMLLSENCDEYTYFKNKMSCAWAGPAYWKPNQFLRNKYLRQLVQSRFPERDPVHATATKRQKKQFEPFDFEEMDVQEFRSSPHCKLKVSTLEKWGEASETLVLPNFHHFEEECLMQYFNRKDCFYRSLQRKGSSDHASSQDKRDTDFSVAASPDMDCADDMDFPATQSDGMPFSQPVASQDTVPQQGFIGDNLVEEPDAIQQIALPFAKYAKRMDVKKLKRVMLDLISNPSLNDSVPAVSKTIEEGAIRFSELYEELPAKIPPNMTKDMSPPIAFVTLLYLANENNLVLQNRDELRDAVTQTSILSQLKDIVIRKE